MARMKGLPWNNYYVNDRQYSADGDGLIANVLPADVSGLVAGGCMLLEPYSHKPEPSAPPGPK